MSELKNSIAIIEIVAVYLAGVDSLKHTCEYLFRWIILPIQMDQLFSFSSRTLAILKSEWKSVHYKEIKNVKRQTDFGWCCLAVWRFNAIRNISELYACTLYTIYFRSHQLLFFSFVVPLIHNRNASMVVNFCAGHHQVGKVEWEKRTRKDEVPNGIPVVKSILAESIENIFFVLLKGVTWKWWTNIEINTPIATHSQCWC